MTDDEQFSKIIGQYQLAINGLVHPLRHPSDADYVHNMIPSLVSLAVQLHYRLSGIDMVYSVEGA